MTNVLLLALIIRVMTDICFKMAVLGNSITRETVILSFVKQVVSRPYLWVALGLSGINFWLWCVVLSHYDLSFAYPLLGICFALIMVCGRLFFNESMDRYKVIGIGMMLLSTVILMSE